MDTDYAPCGDPTCACAPQQPGVDGGVYDQAPAIPELSESGYDKLDNAIEDALEEANERGFSEGFDEGFDAGYEAGVSAGARGALDNLVIASGTPVSPPGSGLDGLIAELDSWAPSVDDVILKLNAWAPSVDDAVDDLRGAYDEVSAQVNLLGELVATILTGHSDLIERTLDVVKELQEKTDADALYLDSLGELVQNITARVDRVEDVTGARRVAL